MQRRRPDRQCCLPALHRPVLRCPATQRKELATSAEQAMTPMARCPTMVRRCLFGLLFSSCAASQRGNILHIQNSRRAHNADTPLPSCSPVSSYPYQPGGNKTLTETSNERHGRPGPQPADWREVLQIPEALAAGRHLSFWAAIGYKDICAC